jgi:multiple sugar transport system permease protein
VAVRLGRRLSPAAVIGPGHDRRGRPAAFSARAAPRAGRSHVERTPIDWAGYVFIVFFTLPFLAFNVAPILFGAGIAFTRWGIFGAPHWIGFKNFTDAFKDEWVWQAFRNTLFYGLIIVPGVVVLGLTFALYVNKRWPLSGLARVLFFSPNVVSATVIGLVWVWMLDTQFGLINHYLGLLGIPNIPWITSTQWSLIGVSLASIWWDLGLAFVLFLAALQDLPAELNEAALVDGASAWQRLRFVILPQLRPVISMVVTLQMIASLRIFSQVYVMTNGGPAGSSTSVIFYVYKMAIYRHFFGYASAVSMLLFVVILVITVFHRWLIREQ